MKFIKYFTLFAFAANITQAETISDEELQNRFSQAFSVFNQQSAPETKQKAEDKKTVNKEEKATVTIKKPTYKEEKNIVKESNTNVITAQTIPAETEKLTLPTMPKQLQKNASNFILLEERPVLIDMQNATLKQIVQEALNQVSQGEEWSIRWALKDEHKYLLEEKINITAEVSFDSFVGNMLETITNITGIRLSTKVFNKNKIIIITDSY